MNEAPEVQPLSQRHRSVFFYLLLATFVVALPLLFLYATGYRYTGFEDQTFISTGGMYVAAERTGAEIYIDNELVRETRAFRRAFYAQGLEPGTHRVHVQKEGHHTWVKELPVYEHLVTEAQAFNIPLVPQLRILSPWKSVTGDTVLQATSTIVASTTNTIDIATTTATTSLIADTEYAALRTLFSTTSATTSPSLFERVSDALTTDATTTATTTAEAEMATTTVESNGVRLYQSGDDVYAVFVGSRDEMPYYYCAEEFELLGTSTTPRFTDPLQRQSATVFGAEASEADLAHPIQQVAEDIECDQTIKIDRSDQSVIAFDFFPGSSDWVIVALHDGVYVTEIDNRAWQNRQPLVLGEGLDMRVENGNVYVFDGNLIYHVQLET